MGTEYTELLNYLKESVDNNRSFVRSSGVNDETDLQVQIHWGAKIEDIVNDIEFCFGVGFSYVLTFEII